MTRLICLLGLSYGAVSLEEQKKNPFWCDITKHTTTILNEGQMDLKYFTLFQKPGVFHMSNK